jgi:hypothetical protein
MLPVLEATTYCSTAGETIAPSMNKTGGQIHGGNISPLPGDEGQNAELKSSCGGGVTQQHCGERQALYCLGKTGNKLKLTVSQREKLICEWNVLVTSHLSALHKTTSENPPALEGPPTTEAWTQTPRAELPLPLTKLSDMQGQQSFSCNPTYQPKKGQYLGQSPSRAFH